MTTEQTLPANVSELSQEQYELYVKEVKAILLQQSYRQVLVLPESLETANSYEIVSIPQTNGGILVQLRAISGTFAAVLESVKQLSATDQQLLRSYLNS